RDAVAAWLCACRKYVVVMGPMTWAQAARRFSTADHARRSAFSRESVVVTTCTQFSAIACRSVRRGLIVSRPGSGYSPSQRQPQPVAPWLGGGFLEMELRLPREPS